MEANSFATLIDIFENDILQLISNVLNVIYS